MAQTLEQKYGASAVTADPNYEGGKNKDNSPSTSNNGTPLKATGLNQTEALHQSAMKDAGFTYNGNVDTPIASQLYSAFKAGVGQSNNLLNNFNFSVKTQENVQPKPDATPRNYAPGYQVFFNWFADPTVGVTDLTYVNGVINFSAGGVYQDVERTGGLHAISIADVNPSIAGADLKPKNSNITVSDTGTSWRVLIGSGATDTISAKLEIGSNMTSHVVLSEDDAVNCVYRKLLAMRKPVDVSSSRVVGVTYTNDTYVEIELVLEWNIESSLQSLAVDGVPYTNSTVDGDTSTLTVTIPPHSEYVSTVPATYKWTELRL